MGIQARLHESPQFKTTFNPYILEGCRIKAHAISHTPLMGCFILQGQWLHTSTGVTFMENCMSSDLSPHRTHSTTIPFHHSSPVIVDYRNTAVHIAAQQHNRQGNSSCPNNSQAHPDVWNLTKMVGDREWDHLHAEDTSTEI